jgi:hypothetical protein
MAGSNNDSGMSNGYDSLDEAKAALRAAWIA